MPKREQLASDAACAEKSLVVARSTHVASHSLHAAPARTVGRMRLVIPWISCITGNILNDIRMQKVSTVGCVFLVGMCWRDRQESRSRTCSCKSLLDPTATATKVVDVGMRSPRIEETVCCILIGSSAGD